MRKAHLLVTQTDTHGDVGCVPIFLHSHFWIWFPMLILYVKKQHEKRHCQSTLLVTEEVGPKATEFRKKCLHCSESWNREAYLPESLAFRIDSRDFSMSTVSVGGFGSNRGLVMAAHLEEGLGASSMSQSRISPLEQELIFLLLPAKELRRQGESPSLCTSSATALGL